MLAIFTSNKMGRKKWGWMQMKKKEINDNNRQYCE